MSSTARPMVEMKTNKGMITVKLMPEVAPKTVENFLKYVDSGFFNGTIFHRVIPGFMVQGGGFTTDMDQKKTNPPVVNEATAEAPNSRGTLAMARTNEINSATSQFFINLVDNSFLNHKNQSAQGFGYCVFGEVVTGMEVVDSIATVATGNHGYHSDVPKEPVIIESAARMTV